MSADNSMATTAAILNAVKARIAALTLAIDGAPAAFERVELFDVESLTDAFRLLIISEQRVAVIISLDEQFEQVDDGNKIVVTRMLPVAIVCSDRRLGDRVKALFGDPEDTTVPGAFALAELALPEVTGQIVDGDGTIANVVATPGAKNSIFLKDEDQQDLPGRAAVMLEIHCRGGSLEARIGPGANL